MLEYTKAKCKLVCDSTVAYKSKDVKQLKSLTSEPGTVMNCT